VRVFFDTSVLVAAFVESHPAHKVSLKRLNKVRAGADTFIIGGHTLAELYAVLTRLPVRPSIGSALARRLIEENTRDAEVSVLSAKDYLRVLAHMDENGLRGGVVYDALLFRAACKAKADFLITLNEKDFRRIQVTENRPLIESP
jgi:predicted nucleic acid-binding protein